VFRDSIHREHPDQANDIENIWWYSGVWPHRRQHLCIWDERTTSSASVGSSFRCLLDDSFKTCPASRMPAFECWSVGIDGVGRHRRSQGPSQNSGLVVRMQNFISTNWRCSGRSRSPATRKTRSTELKRASLAPGGRRDNLPEGRRLQKTRRLPMRQLVMLLF
jgi:hypothetical protein